MFEAQALQKIGSTNNLCCFNFFFISQNKIKITVFRFMKHFTGRGGEYEELCTSSLAGTPNF